ncbi:hypothetical protein NQ317_010970 [Molorchus minor]|uniref:Uncharacterized protein n=1 Tax=Molorchus minor TaxID=1323400 RepID=A0ABQ9J2S3_9CUCU|nr:hypothetical protein NQ317_010970 [Molorchus minor]
MHLDVDNDALQYVYNYWKLKRKAGHNRPLLPPKSEDVDMLSHKREQADLEKMKISDVSMKNDDRSSNTANDSQNKLRTKAAVKEFSQKLSSRSSNKGSPENKKRPIGNHTKKNHSSKKKGYVPSDLIVPQRQAAKKATENLKSNTTRTKDHVSPAEDSSNSKIEEKPKQKVKTKSKDSKEPLREEKPPPASKREEQTRSRGRGRGTSRGRPRLSNSGDRLRDADVRPRDMSDGQRIGVEGERAKGRNGKQQIAGEELGPSSFQKEITKPNRQHSPVRKTDKKLKVDREPGAVDLEREIIERKAGKEGSTRTKSTLDKLLEKASKCNEKFTKPIEWDSKLPEKTPRQSEKIYKSPERSSKLMENVTKRAERHSGLIDKIKPIEKPTKVEHLLKSPNKELKEQIDKKADHKDMPEKKPTNKRSPTKVKNFDDVCPSKLSNSESKENKVDAKQPPTSKPMRSSDEITIADKIVNDHLQIQKANEFYNRQSDDMMNKSPAKSPGKSPRQEAIESMKRRGRPPRPSQQPTAPKLKIKIGNNTNSIVGATRVDDKKDRIRPPKKRRANMNMISVEELKRESMKFRKLVMQELKTKKKKDKSEKKKKKKHKGELYK